MSSGVSRRITGAVTGTGALIAVTTVGFRPRRVRILNVTGLANGEWINTMADDSVVKQITAGTMTLETSDGIIPLANGFSIGADTDLNVSAELIHYVAEE